MALLVWSHVPSREVWLQRGYGPKRRYGPRGYGPGMGWVYGASGYGASRYRPRGVWSQRRGSVYPHPPVLTYSGGHQRR